MRSDRDRSRGIGRSSWRTSGPADTAPPAATEEESAYDWDQPVVAAKTARDALLEANVAAPSEQTDATDRQAEDPSGPTERGGHSRRPASGVDSGSPEHDAVADPLLAPQDQAALQRGLVRVAQAAHDHGQALAVVAAQLEALQRRLDELDEPVPAQSGPEVKQLGHEVAVAAERTVSLDERLTRLEQLPHDVTVANRRTADLGDRLATVERRGDQATVFVRRADALEARLNSLEQRGEVPVSPAGTDELDQRLSALEGRLDQRLSALEGRVQDGPTAARHQLAALDERIARIEQLRDQLAVATDERLSTLDGRLSGLESMREAMAAGATSLDERAGGLDQRLGALDGRLHALDSRLGGLEEVGRDAAAGTEERVAALAECLARLESLPADIENMAADQSRRLTTELRSLEERLTGLEALPAAMEELVEARMRSAATELLSLPGDVEGVYKELDAVAERVAARDATVAAQLERVANLDRSVRRLREDLGQVIASLTDLRREAPPDVLARVEERLDALESPGGEVERLRRSLRRLIDEQDEAGPDAAEGGPEGGAGVVQALSTELHRIRRSLEVLPTEDTGG